VELEVVQCSQLGVVLIGWIFLSLHFQKGYGTIYLHNTQAHHSRSLGVAVVMISGLSEQDRDPAESLERQFYLIRV
jgi:hypothetical protein